MKSIFLFNFYRYRWFAVFYLIMMFFVIPGGVLGLSVAGQIPLIVVLSIIGVIFLGVLLINIAQSKRPDWLPTKLKTWEFLPLWMRSLQPLDRLDFLKQVTTNFLISKFETLGLSFVPELDSSHKYIYLEPIPGFNKSRNWNTGIGTQRQSLNAYPKTCSFWLENVPFSRIGNHYRDTLGRHPG